MFPPERVEDSKEWVTNIWESLQRTSPDALDSVQLDEDVEDVRVTFFFRNPQTDLVSKTMGRYVRDYAKESGWLVKKAICKRGYIFFVASRAASRSAKKD